MNTFFNQKDIDEIADMIEIAKNSSIDGKRIDCFPMVYSLALGKSNLSDYSQHEIKEAIEQVALEKDFFQSIDSLDCSLFNKVICFLEGKKSQ